MSTQRHSRLPLVPEHELPRGPNGRPCCRWCHREVPQGRRTFCDQRCVDEWLVRKSSQGAREVVWKRDRGVCALCRLDTKIVQRLYPLYSRGRCVTLTQDQWRRWLVGLGWPESVLRWGWQGALWQADHIVPVVEGGGECGLDNLRTLCHPCHVRVTAELAARRAQEKRRAHWERKLGGWCQASLIEPEQAEQLEQLLVRAS